MRLVTAFLLLFSVFSLNAADMGHIKVTGESSVSRKPSMARISVGIEINANSVSEANSSMASRANKIVNYLKKQSGVSKVETGNMRISTNYHYKNKEGVKEYNAQMQITFDSNLKSAAEHLDECLLLGGNRVQGYVFMLTPEEMQKAELDAIRKAIEDAGAQIQQVTSALRITDSKVVEVYVENTPTYRNNALFSAGLRSSKESSAPIEVETIEIKKRVNITVDYHPTTIPG